MLYFSQRVARENIKLTDDVLIRAARETNDWRSLYDVFCVLLGEKNKRIENALTYLEPHIDHMWAASIAGALLDCDFREAKEALINRLDSAQESGKGE